MTKQTLKELQAWAQGTQRTAKAYARLLDDDQELRRKVSMAQAAAESVEAVAQRRIEQRHVVSLDERRRAGR